MSQLCPKTAEQLTSNGSYVERDRLSFTQSEADWQFDCIMDNGISSSVEELEQDWSNAKGLELMFRDKGTINKTMCGTRVHQGDNGNGRD